MTEQEAKRFIAEQTERMLECGVNGMTRKQRARVKALDVVDPDDRAMVLAWANAHDEMLGRPPHGDTGMMRVVNFRTGEMRIQRAPRRKLDLELDEAIEAVAV